MKKDKIEKHLTMLDKVVTDLREDFARMELHQIIHDIGNAYGISYDSKTQIILCPAAIELSRQEVVNLFRATPAVRQYYPLEWNLFPNNSLSVGWALFKGGELWKE